MARASAAAAAETARQIREVAIDLFADKGYAAVSIDEIAEAAGVTRGAIYHHYKSKAGLFEAAADWLAGTVGDVVAATADAVNGDPADQLSAGCHAFLDAITAEGPVRILLIDGPSVLGWAHWRRTDAGNSETHLREALRAVGLEGTELDATTAHLSGAMNEAALWVARQHTDTDTLAAAHTVLDRLVSAAVQGY